MQRVRPLVRESAKGLALCIFLLLSATSFARSIQTINAEKAREAARDQVIWKDRLCTFSTLSLDFLESIYGKSSYKGLKPEQVVYGWLLRPDVWKDEPMIRITDKDLCQQLRIEGEYARFSELFDDTLGYKLNHLGENLPERMRQLVRESPSAIELDEKVGMIILLTQGRLIQPRPSDRAPLPAWRVEAEIIWNNLTAPWLILTLLVIVALGLVWSMLYSRIRSFRKG